MKRLNHLFQLENFDIPLYGYIASGSFCKYCGVESFSIYLKMSKKDQVYLRKLICGLNRIDEEYKFYNRYHPCLTEDEFIIKSIIE